ncbi:MAG: C39 family peptidase [Nocardioides sp.]
MALAALLLLLALLPFVPHGGSDDGAIVPSGRVAARPASSGTAGYGRVTAAMSRTIDRLLTSPTPRLLPDASPRMLASALTRCAIFEGQRYCLGVGWTDQTQTQVAARLGQAAARRTTVGEQTGDLDPMAVLERQARLNRRARATQERAELTQAARSVAKVWLLRHEIQGVPLPQGFWAEHPEARALTSPTLAARTGATPSANPTVNPSPMLIKKRYQDYPNHQHVLDPQHVQEQHQTYWCGPATMQMIGWAWKGYRNKQRYWADRLHTTTSGTSISDMVRLVNASTGYDRKTYAGPYVVLDISDYGFKHWMTLMMRHFVDYHAPVVLHPVLLTQFYPYLDHDGSGHFQVGRGYRKRPGKEPLLSYFEPWDQQRFHPDEPYIGRVQWRDAYKSYRANQAHFQHNVGV